MKKHLILLILISCLTSCIDDTELSDIKVKASIINPSGYNVSDGEIVLEIKNASEPVEIRWHKYTLDTISKEKKLSNIKSGQYLLEISDNEGREYRDTFFLVTNDTIYPKEYLPVYPGSYWEYSDGSRIECESEYEKVLVYKSLAWHPPFNYGITIPLDSVYVPIYNGVPVLEYSIINHNNRYDPLIPILFVNEGQAASLIRDARYGASCLKTITTDTTIYINNIEFTDVIVTVSGYDPSSGYCDDFSENYLNISKKYYAKNIGLIKEEYKERPEDAYTLIREIENWWINFPN